MAFLPTGSDQKLDKVPLATFSIIVLNLIIHFFLVSDLPWEERHELYLKWGWVTDEASPVRLVCRMFLHGGWFHVIVNMIFLWAFGAYLETVVGSRRFLLYYLAGGAGAAALYSVTQIMFFSERTGVPCVGASGAISGIMGVFMIRCYFTKVMTAVGFYPIFWAPRRLKVNAWLMAGFYLATNIINGLRSIDGAFSSTAYWSHLGGFAAGILISLASGHLKEARVHKRRNQSEKLVNAGVGLGEARKQLNQILDIDRTDGWALLDLARIEARYRLGKKGEILYCRAFSAFWKKGDKDSAVAVFDEYYKKFRAPFPAGLQLSLTRELIRQRQYDLAARGLEALIERSRREPASFNHQTLEQAYILLGRLLSERLGLFEPAMRTFREFLKRFPQSQSADMARHKLAALSRITGAAPARAPANG